MDIEKGNDTKFSNVIFSSVAMLLSACLLNQNMIFTGTESSGNGLG